MFLKNIINGIERYRGIIIILSIVALLYYGLCHFTPLAFDDYAYSFSLYDNQRISSIDDILKSLLIHYNEMNGRIVSHFFAYLFLWIDKNVFDLVATFFFILLGLLIYYNGIGSLKKINIYILMLVYLCLFVLTPKFGENYLWITGACNYLFMSVVFFLYWSFYVKRINCRNNVLILALFMIGGIIVGNTHECIASISLCLFTIHFILFKKKNLLLFLCSFLGTLNGAFFLLFAPGQIARIDKTGVINVIGILENLIRITFSIIEYFYPIFVFVFILLLLKRSQCEISKTKLITYLKSCFENHPLIILYSLVFFITVYALSIMPSVPDGRVWTFYLQLLIVVVCILLKEIDNKCMKFINNAIILSFALTAIVCTKYILKSESIYSSWQHRNVEISEMIESGLSKIEITPLGKSNKYHVFSHRGEEVSVDPDYWINITMARYYGLDSIKMAPINNYN